MVGFVNYGRNYAGARDEFVYAYSHDDPRADTPADRFILMRAPKSRLTERAAWEFFAKHDAFGQPVWTHNSDERGAVFENEGACLRSAMTYCAPLKRYLWWQHIPRRHWRTRATAVTPDSQAALPSTTRRNRGAHGRRPTLRRNGMSVPVNTATSPPSG